MPTDSSKVKLDSQATQPLASEFAKNAKGVQKKNFWNMRLEDMREAMKIPDRMRYSRSCQILFEVEFMRQ